MRRPLFLLLQSALVLVALGLTGCDTFGELPCKPACDDGLECDDETGQCRPPELPAHEGTPPGRSTRLATTDDAVYLAAIDPDRKTVVVGRADDGEPKVYELGEVQDAKPRRVALSATESLVVAAWRHTDGRFRVAIHRPDDDIRRWQVSRPIDASQETYAATSHFDVASVDDETLHLVFHDDDANGLHLLEGSVADDAWTLSSIDAPGGGDEGNGHCRDSRRVDDGGQLGLRPDLEIDDGALFVSYRDDACGDLRLARRVDNEWVVSVVETGEGDADASTSGGDVGQFSSLAFDSTGRLAIAFYDGGRGRLALAHEDDGQFELEAVDEGYQFDEASRRRKHMVGGFADLTFDEDDHPVIAHMDGTRARMRLVERREPLDREGAWAARLLSPPAPVGFSASIAHSTATGTWVAAERFTVESTGPRGRLELVSEDDL